jgi:hypothetical protein
MHLVDRVVEVVAGLAPEVIGLRNQLWADLKPADTPGHAQAPWVTETGLLEVSDAEFCDPTSMRKRAKDMAYALANQGDEWAKEKIPKLNLLGPKAPAQWNFSMQTWLLP